MFSLFQFWATRYTSKRSRRAGGTFTWEPVQWFSTQPAGFRVHCPQSHIQSPESRGSGQRFKVWSQVQVWSPQSVVLGLGPKSNIQDPGPRGEDQGSKIWGSGSQAQGLDSTVRGVGPGSRVQSATSRVKEPWLRALDLRFNIPGLGSQVQQSSPGPAVYCSFSRAEPVSGGARALHEVCSCDIPTRHANPTAVSSV